MNPAAEWFEADGLGGFACGTASGIRTRRYHALLLTARTPPTGRVVLVNGFEAAVDTRGGSFALTSHAYLPDVTHPDGANRVVAFGSEPWPRWTFALPDGSRVHQELFVPRGASAAVLRWTREGGDSDATLRVRPLLSGRDYHALHRENSALRFATETRGDVFAWRPYPDLPAILSRANGRFAEDPLWYRNFRYTEEQARGLDFVEDLASPGEFTFDLGAGEAVWLIAAEGNEAAIRSERESPAASAERLREAEARRRAAFPSLRQRCADAYAVRRGAGRTLVAGYPWFTDWGRDTFIALRGICLATGRLDLAREILLEWAGAVSQGMLPNRFPDRGEFPEYNAVDASLWFVLVVSELEAALRAKGERLAAAERKRLHGAVDAIVEGYAAGTRHGIRMDADGLLACGEPGVQLTWMDAKVGDWVVTPRIGKPVEVQALWLHALDRARARSARWNDVHARARAAFEIRFWNAEAGCLYDVVDVDHHPGVVDASFRPNQIFAAGGLPVRLLDPARVRRVVDEVERRLWTPVGLRSLAPDEPGYRARYEGGVLERDGAYHQGTVWPWLAGPFVEAWVRVRGDTPAARREARVRFLEPLLAAVGDAASGHVPEIADAEPPHRLRGCPFQAWSLAEVLRLELDVLAENDARPSPD